VLLTVVAALGLVTLLLTAFGSGGSSRGTAPVEVETVSAVEASAVRPRPQVLATIGNLNIQLPVAAASVTAIGFHGSRDGSLSLQPVGRQANEGLLARLWRNLVGARRDFPRWYQLEDGPPGTHILDVGVPPATDVYAPVDGTVIAVSDLEIGGTNVGSRVDLRPSVAPSVMVSIMNVHVDPSIAVGTPVVAAASKLGTAVDVTAVEEQALAAHAPDGGNNVSVAVYPSPGSLP
jgi:hypothetical protein